VRRHLIGFLSAEALSMTGSQISFITLPWLILVMTGSAVRTGLGSFTEMVPYVLAGLLGGPLIDRFGPRRTAILADSASAISVALIPTLHAIGGLSYPVVLVLVASAGTLRGFGDTSKRTLLPRVVEMSRISIDRGATLYDGISRGAMLLGLPLAGALITWLGAANVLVVDAASFVCCAVLVSTFVPVKGATQVDKESTPTEGYGAALLKGLRTLRRDRLVLGIVAMLFLTNLFDQANSAVFVPVWVHDVLGSPAGIGLMGGAFGVGAVLGNVIYTILSGRLSRFATFSLCFLLGGSTRLFALASTDRLWIVVAVSFGAGIFMSTVNPILSSVAYQRIAKEMHGRVLGAIGALTWGGIPIGGLLAGWAVQALGLRQALFSVATAYLGVTLLPLVLPIWRQLDDKRRTDSPATPDSPAAAELQTP
jgi:MFS family permease